MFEIRTGEEFKVVLNNVEESTKARVENGVLRVEEGRTSWRFFERSVSNREIIIYIPEDMEFGNVEIKSGVGRIYIETLVAQTAEFRLGVGEVRISELSVKGNARIEGGVGRLKIESGTINNLRLDSGVGETEIRAGLTGNNRIESGVGRLRLNLVGKIDEYTLGISTGIGRITVNGERQNEGTYGSGTNNISITGGVGAVEITTDTD